MKNKKQFDKWFIYEFDKSYKGLKQITEKNNWLQ